MILNPEHIQQLVDAATDAFYIMDPDVSAKATLDVDEEGVTIDFSRAFEITLRMPDGDTIEVTSPEKKVLVPLEQVRFVVATFALESSQNIAKELGLA